MSESATTKSAKSEFNSHVTKKLHGNGNKKTLKKHKYEYNPTKPRIRPKGEAEIAMISYFRRNPEAVDIENKHEAHRNRPKKRAKAKPQPAQ